MFIYEGCFIQLILDDDDDDDDDDDNDDDHDDDHDDDDDTVISKIYIARLSIK